VFAYWLGGAGNAVASVLLLTGCHLQVHRETTINAPIMYCGNPDDETTCRQEIPPQAP
jgi:hypothetical protein